jgi:RND family efflux transporter MFP subunit
VSQATAAVAAARAQAEAAVATQGFAAITAPFDGVVTERFADPGNLAAPGAPLLRLDASGTPRVEARVDERRVEYVRPGDVVDVIVDEGEGVSVEGTVSEVGRAIDAGARAFTVKVVLPAGVAPRSGTFARLRFRGAVRQALAIPAAAVRRQGQVTSVFVVRDGVARLRLVQAGAADGERITVLSGLDAGEVVVSHPPPALADGQPVRGGR